MNFRKISFLIVLIIFTSCASNNSDDSIPNPTNQCDATVSNISDLSFDLWNENDINLFLQNGYTEVVALSIKNQSDLSFLSCIEKIFSLSIENCTITSFEGLSNLQELERLNVRFCNNLINFEGIGPIHSLEAFDVSYNDNLLNFQGLESLSSISGMEITYNEGLQNFEGFNNISNNTLLPGFNYGGNWNISDNENLESISALNNISGELKSGINIHNNLILSELGYFSQLINASNVGIVINGFSQLTTIDCFPNITDFGSISITNNDNLESITFNSLVRTSFLKIVGNNSLNNLNFNALTELYGSAALQPNMEINYNDSLTSLNGFENLTSNARPIEINDGYAQFENPLSNVCSIRNLMIEQINSATAENKVLFKSSCYSYFLNSQFGNISEFDAICNCN